MAAGALGGGVGARPTCPLESQGAAPAIRRDATNAPAQAALSSSGAAVRGGKREGGNENVSASLEEVLVTFGDANTARAT
jgi:hypothetical protein